MAFSSNGEVVRVARGVPPVSDETEKTGGTPVPLFQPLDQDGFIDTQSGRLSKLFLSRLGIFCRRVRFHHKRLYVHVRSLLFQSLLKEMRLRVDNNISVDRTANI